MTVINLMGAPGVTRRKLFLVVAGVAAGAALPAEAQTKVAQKLANYQTTPQGKSRCDGCTQWQGPSSCKVVSGVISPSGWCSLYAPKPKS